MFMLSDVASPAMASAWPIFSPAKTAALSAANPDMAEEMRQLAAQVMVLRDVRNSLKDTIQKLELVARQKLARMIEMQTQFDKLSEKDEKNEQSQKTGTGQKKKKKADSAAPEKLDTASSDNPEDLAARMKAFQEDLTRNLGSVKEANELLEQNKICKLSLQARWLW
jgi:hypothetical protein